MMTLERVYKRDAGTPLSVWLARHLPQVSSLDHARGRSIERAIAISVRGMRCDVWREFGEERRIDAIMVEHLGVQDAAPSEHPRPLV